MTLLSFDHPENSLDTPTRDASSTPVAPRAPRTLTLLLVGRVIGDRRDALCRIRNLSEGGLRAEVRARFTLGESVRIEFRNSDAVTGVVRWTDRKAIGVQFDAPVDVERLLAESTTVRRKGAPAPRAPRLPTSCWADIRIDGHPQRASLLDLSQGGAKLRTRTPLEMGAILILSVPGLEPMRGVVRWVRGDNAGIAFLEPIAFAALAAWLDDPATRYAAAVAWGE
ncbi:PilZ domain-containing protein [Sphingomonas cavernae]|uniref:PilZ domain-containing protein n=1 Tax=Sphingomonas cavernae TaxID=2320861 RepID=A0A418W6X9_9SPHN|nr:PilZ domain-containing protein [Sphingomonas cavernae]RJF85717.1 PilZ domain-containing protein [Sphingomonas cavernae]